MELMVCQFSLQSYKRSSCTFSPIRWGRKPMDLFPMYLLKMESVTLKLQELACKTELVN